MAADDIWRLIDASQRNVVAFSNLLWARGPWGMSLAAKPLETLGITVGVERSGNILFAMVTNLIDTKVNPKTVARIERN